MKRFFAFATAMLVVVGSVAHAGGVGFDLPRLDFPKPPVTTSQDDKSPARLPSR